MQNVLLLIFLLTAQLNFGQTLRDFGDIPEPITKPISTEDLLKKLNWKSVDKFCGKNDGFYSYMRPSETLISFEYVKQGRVESFEIVSYKGEVLEFYLDIPNEDRRSEYYFNKQLWLEYTNELLPGLPENFILSLDEPVDVFKGFYELLGVNTADEYGWICEYSTVGMPPDRRRGVIQLINNERTELLRLLLNHENPQIKLYAIDALIYMDRGSNILSEQDWQLIYDFRDSETIIRTCGNMGSYKVYETPISELLSTKAIKQIPKNYKVLKELGYLE